MKQFLASLWWWIRVLVLVTVGLYAMALLWKNSKQTASIWYWPGRPVEETNIMAFGLAAFLLGGLTLTIGWALGTATVNLRRTRAARKKRAEMLAREEMERKASMLRVKPAPTPVVRPRVEPRAPEPVPVETDPVPSPAVEPSPEVALAPAPVVVIDPAKRGPVHPAPQAAPKPDTSSPSPVQSVLAASAPKQAGAEPTLEESLAPGKDLLPEGATPAPGTESPASVADAVPKRDGPKLDAPAPTT